ncbi:hypothetical protein OC610_05915 [Pseudomonas sp. SAICEU22]|uniref:Big-1 domain-containing protein n=1 Tax=Pseudomonas agronomica TaxID=2979328 RepID=A0ABT3F4B7_9PSED|nr:hypothetical protein [Pseudomonas agronomica]MCW1243934.1 hypothetical protein [Pseudomonas agronomica]
MSKFSDSARQSVVIGEVHEASIDPMVGESVMMAIKVVSSTDRTAASAVSVVFSVRQVSKQVATDSQGWARFTYTADETGEVQVIATLGESEGGPSHTFRFEILAAGVWGGAQFQFDNDPVTAWGQEAGFPRLSQRHTVRLMPTSGSSLIGRDICLGLKSYLSASALGLTVTPALGSYRPLTDQGLSWECVGTGAGAYAFQLAASRILKLSPDNTMSLTRMPVPSAEISNEVRS